MIFDPASAPHLKPWLVRTLEPICDAEPGALAEYILALLKHNVPEADMRKELQVQLEEFLESECAPFINTLFTVLRTKSYLPYSTNPPSPRPTNSQDEGIAIPLDEIMGASAGPSDNRSRKRNMADDLVDGRPIKGARLNVDGDFSRYGNGNGGGWGGRPQMDGAGHMAAYGMGMGMNTGVLNGGRRPNGYQPPGQKRGICRDYHNHGFCARGDMCKYSHGDDAVIPSQLYSMPPMMPLNYLYNMFNPAAAGYDPNDSRMDIRPGGRQNQRAPIIPRVQQEDGSHALQPLSTSGELPVIQDLTPSAPPNSGNPEGDPGSSLQHQHQQQQQAFPGMHNPMAMLPGFDPAMFAGMQPNFGGMPFAPPMEAAPSSGSDGSGPSGRDNNNFRGRGGRPHRGRGGFGADASSFRPPRRGDKTLVVEKIPDDKLSIEQISNWFKKFGNVKNVAVDPHGAKALVSFGTHEEAHAAWKSEDAVFNNRFVKVFWHKPMEGHGQAGQRALAASATLVANLAAKDAGPANASSSTGTASTSTSAAPSTPGPKKSTTQSAASAALAAKQELLEKQIAEQKSLMEKLSTVTPEEKKEIMSRLRKLGEEMSSGTSSVTTSSTTTSTKGKAVDTEPKEGSVVDKDVEMQSAPSTEPAEETTGQLKARLEKLKAEAASLGISESGETAYSGYRGGYRGRGRGRGSFYRGGPPIMRGGPPRGSLKLDNRPKKLLVKGIDESQSQTVREWYESLGQVDNIETVAGGDVLVSFKSRAAAEQGLGKGSHIPGVGKVQIAWYTGKPSTTTTGSSQPPPGSATTTTTSTTTTKDGTSALATREPSPVHEDEEVIASGWGEDDSMGML
ncbi:hypothetical protein FA15DRAFT_154339 [Coprinopsis marcescibilis]|uniref:C3H1-type domain-containing protein n=1 Tax=Coprinopsis marcescibilis TaxID=230819 RepID=A0A5C3KI35_COPMA|nr:hypothetical protein FA15DRAFT_154339 [Coprinopsis marcescibilis]